MKLFWSLIISMAHVGIYAQSLKTIFTNERDAVALFFPGTISQALTGSENYTFSYNRDSPQHVGIVQGVRGKNSNLLVITETGDIYSYRLAYRKVLDTLSYFVKDVDRIGNEFPPRVHARVDSVSKTVGSESYDSGGDSLRYRMKYFENFSFFQLEQNNGSLKRKRKKGVVLRLRDLIYDRNEVYALIEIRNRSGVDFEVDYLKNFKVHGNKRRKSSYQKIPLNMLYTKNFPKMVKDRQNVSFVVVLPKFTLGDSEKLMLELKERNGGRNMRLFYR
ncbi:DUF4138 domain-containing protein [Pricia sp. S334]|uniref:DUF4138 domain-containing protein n=1 Tax=Pricia mediterranea TaxID=3076079 RepID=A0ABU3L4L9_9FLAO|nr:DUF4138 domain-containing protein [Pricia sp. S334]MDT7828377.1 DUF4138 domain-containing protein [Pricia sp. S334]